MMDLWRRNRTQSQGREDAKKKWGWVLVAGMGWALLGAGPAGVGKEESAVEELQKRLQEMAAANSALERRLGDVVRENLMLKSEAEGPAISAGAVVRGMGNVRHFVIPMESAAVVKSESGAQLTRVIVVKATTQPTAAR